MSKDITRVIVPPPTSTDAPSVCTQTNQDAVRGKRLKDMASQVQVRSSRTCVIIL